MGDVIRGVQAPALQSGQEASKSQAASSLNAKQGSARTADETGAPMRPSDTTVLKEKNAQ